MSLTDTQIRELCEKMRIPLATDGIIFKDEFPTSPEYNKTYFINLEDEYNGEGMLNSGSHWTCLQIAKYANGTVAPLYVDAYGMPPPEVIKERVMKFTKQKLPFNTKDIQSLMANACGWYCCAWAHFVNNFSHRQGDLYEDTETFLSYFDDLNKSTNFLKNEYILKHFFQPEDPNMRRKITTIADVEQITNDTNGGIDGFKMVYNK
jgi:hypothetical protein